MAMPPSTVNSFKTPEIPRPLIMISRMAWMNHFAGIICAIACNAMGMLSMGNINPDNRMVGNINPMTDISKATSCESTLDDMSKPKILIYWKIH